MTRTNGRLLGVGGLRRMEREVAPMINSDKDTSAKNGDELNRRGLSLKGKQEAKLEKVLLSRRERSH